MAEYVVTDIDKWLVRNKRDVFELLQKQGKRIPDFDRAKFEQIKTRWNDVEKATKTNEKLERWTALQKDLSPIFKSATDNVNEFDAKISKWKEDPNFPGLTGESKDKYDFWAKLNDVGNNRPDNDKEMLSNLSPEKAFSDKYNYKQMKHLAGQYGYNYDDPAERAEFVSKVGEVVHQNDLDKIWNDGTVAGAAVDFMLPVSKEYARQNYEDIDASNIASTLTDMPLAVGADLGINALMGGAGGKLAGGIGGKFAGNKVGQILTKQGTKNFINNTSAPMLKAAANVGLNDESLADAGRDILGEVSTNIATPFMLKGGFRWASRLKNGEEAMAAKDYINAKAKAARATQNKLLHGGVFEDYAMNPDGIENVTYKSIGKENGKYVIKEIPYDEYARNKNKITQKELYQYGEDAKLLRGKRPNAVQAVEGEYAPDIKPAGEYVTENKMRNASMQGQDPMSVLNADELEVFGATPKESRWNWASTNVGDVPGSYVTNAQGRGQFGTQFLTSISTLDPTHKLPELAENLKKEKKLTDADKAELEMLRRMYLLSQNPAYKNLISEPALPDKYKDYGITLKDVFGK